MFVKRYDFLEKFLRDCQMVCLEQVYIEFWILLTMLQWTNITFVISRCGTFSPFFFSAVSFSVLPSNFIVSGVKAQDSTLFYNWYICHHSYSMNKKQLLLYTKPFGRINHNQLLNEYVLHNFFASYQTLLIVKSK